MPEKDTKPSDNVEKPPEDPFPELTKSGDPSLRLVAWLIKNRDHHQLYLRTGIRRAEEKKEKKKEKEGERSGWVRPIFDLLKRFASWLAGEKGNRNGNGPAKPPYEVPLLLETEGIEGNPQIAQELHDKYRIPLAYRKERNINPSLKHVSARLPLTDEIFNGSYAGLVDECRTLIGNKVTRLSLGVPGQPSRERESWPDHIGLPPKRTYDGHDLTGEGVVVGIIDDGCALAHCNFLKPRETRALPESRVLYLWDQAGNGNTAAGWTAPPDFDGLELGKAKIDDALKTYMRGDVIEEDKVYDYLGYKIGSVASHGTHVMDIAAGNGQTLMGWEGVAPGADIIFVQLPAPTIEGGATAMWTNILDGIAYVFARAEAMVPPRPAVVNISYGGYDGPHDGTSELEQAMDGLLAKDNRAVVIAAGNSFEACCHASKEVAGAKIESLRWIVRPEDPTPNDMEIWYGDKKKSSLWFRLQSPRGGTAPAGWIQLGYTGPIVRTSDSKIIGQIEHLPSGTGNGDNRVVINLRPTERTAEDDFNAPAPSGLWTIDIRNTSGPKVAVHAWIWRDDAGRPGNARRRQARFHPDDADPKHTIAGWATGTKTISVGAFNSATEQVCRYSACGPTRPTGKDKGRAKPEIYAPAEEDARGRGVLSASSLSARPTRMNGTSASAPHVTGLIALMFEYAQKHAPGKPVNLTADHICRRILAAARTGRLKFNRHQIADKRVKTKQQQVKAELNLLASGKIDFLEAMKKPLP